MNVLILLGSYSFHIHERLLLMASLLFTTVRELMWSYTLLLENLPLLVKYQIQTSSLVVEVGMKLSSTNLRMLSGIVIEKLFRFKAPY